MLYVNVRDGDQIYKCDYSGFLHMYSSAFSYTDLNLNKYIWIILIALSGSRTKTQPSTHVRERIYSSVSAHDLNDDFGSQLQLYTRWFITSVTLIFFLLFVIHLLLSLISHHWRCSVRQCRAFVADFPSASLPFGGCIITILDRWEAIQLPHVLYWIGSSGIRIRMEWMKRRMYT